MTDAAIGYGAEFGIGSGDPVTYTAVAEVTAITPPSFTRAAIDATHLKSTDRYDEVIPGMITTGEASITLNFEPSATDALLTAFGAGTGQFQITYPNGVMMRFAGICTGYTPPELNTERMSMTATFKPTGKPTLHAAS